jgi:hypothetical protein
MRYKDDTTKNLLEGMKLVNHLTAAVFVEATEAFIKDN